MKEAFLFCQVPSGGRSSIAPLSSALSRSPPRETANLARVAHSPPVLTPSVAPAPLLSPHPPPLAEHTPCPVELLRRLARSVSWASLANKPTEDNEILKLVDADGAVITEVNYQQENGWPPPDRSGASHPQQSS